MLVNRAYCLRPPCTGWITRYRRSSRDWRLWEADRATERWRTHSWQLLTQAIWTMVDAFGSELTIR